MMSGRTRTCPVCLVCLQLRLAAAGFLPPGGAGAALEAHGREPGLHAVRAQELRHH